MKRSALNLLYLAMAYQPLAVNAATVDDGSVSPIVGVNAGLCLGVKGSTSASGALLQSQNCSGSNYQSWIMEFA